MKILTIVFSAAAVMLFSSCGRDESFIRSLPAIPSFDIGRYMGTWYEIARFPHSFERDLVKVTAEYSLNTDGTVRVVNSGSPLSDPSKRKTAVGKAKSGDEITKGFFRVSFFGPFYGDYRIISLDEGYQYVLVTSSSRDYLWILCRTKTMDRAVFDKLTGIAKNLGFDMSKLYIVPQE
jgi:lipocalin